MQFPPPPPASSSSSDVEKYLLFFAQSQNGKNVTCVALNDENEKEKDVAEKLMRMMTPPSSSNPPFVLPVDSAPKESLLAISRSFAEKERREEKEKSVDEEMAKSARRTLERLLSRKTEDDMIHYYDDIVGKKIPIASARSVNVNVMPSRDNDGESKSGFTIEEEDEATLARREDAYAFFGGDANGGGGRSDFVRGSTRNAPHLPGGMDEIAEKTEKFRMERRKRAHRFWLEEYVGVGEGDDGHSSRGCAPPGFERSVISGRERRATDTIDAFDEERASGARGGEIAAAAMERDQEMKRKAENVAKRLGMLTFEDVLGNDWMEYKKEAEEDEEEEEEEDEEEEEKEKESGEDLDDDDGEDDDPIESLLREHDQQSTSVATQLAKDVKEEMKKIEKWAITTPIPDVDAFYRSTVGDSPAKTFPFELDAFQKEAIARIERDECVFVAAHTSAGKTVVAEYAFALAQKRCARAIYTSPIKTISNQKFRDFTDAGFDVGLLTGDVSVKPESSCLIMTTEILRSMLYRGADIIKDVEWVVFDEVHYVNDRERGVVWEEVIIMLPKHVGIVMLSATVPNVREFAGWVGKTKRKKVFITGTKKRPVPLEHELYFGGDDPDKDFHLVGEKEQFLPLGYQKALKAKERKDMGVKAALLKDQGLNKQEVKKPNAGRGGGSGAGSRNRTQQREGFVKQSVKTTGSGQSTKTNTGKNQWVELIRTLEKKLFLPMVVFAFSKRKCDLLADGITGVDLTTSKEKHETHIFCEKALSRLSPADRTLPQVTRVRELLSRGLGVHHAGLLPIVKEIVEMLFCRGNVKVLFSTETFAMGVNAPARCVCFESLRKHDGQEFRFLLPGEYTQMAGRAGRRGKDTVGTVILSCWDNFPTENTLRKLLVGTATKLESQFRLTFAMILNVARAEDLKVEDVLARSFAEFHAQKTVGNRESRLRHAIISLTRARDLISTEASRDPFNWTRAVVCSRAAKLIKELGERANEAIVKSRGFREALGSPGRVVLVKDDKGGFARFAVALRVIKEEKDGDVKRSVVVMAIKDEGHDDDFQDDDDLDASVDTQLSKGEDEDAGGSSNLRLVSKKKKHDDDDDDDMFGGFGGGKSKRGGKKTGGGGGGGGLSKASSTQLTSNQPAISEENAQLPKDLPWRKRAGGFDYVVFVIRDIDIYAVTALKLQDVDAYAILDDASPPRKADQRAAATRVLSVLEHETKSIRNKQDDDTPLSSLLLQTLDPTKDLKITNVDDAEACRRHAEALAQLPSMPTDVDSKTLSQWSRLLDCERHLLHQIDQLKFGLSDANLALTPDFETKTRVLKYMGYLDEARAVTLKGRVACELSTGDELIGAEIVFGGCLEKLTPAEAAALLSALVFQEKNASAPDYDALPVNLKDSIALANTLAIRAGDIQRDFGLSVIGDEYCAENLKFGLSEVVYRWALMDPFSEICQLTDVPEGTIVRTITRLNETCRDVKNVARIIGDASLSQKMEDAMALIRRDIVFSASLYVGS